MKNEFTKDELYFIEREFDIKLGIYNRELRKTALELMSYNPSGYNTNELKKEHKDAVLKAIMNEIQEINEAINLIKSIRTKCENERNEKT